MADGGDEEAPAESIEPVRALAYVDLGDGKPTLIEGVVDRIEAGQVVRELKVAPGVPRQ